MDFINDLKWRLQLPSAWQTYSLHASSVLHRHKRSSAFDEFLTCIASDGKTGPRARVGESEQEVLQFSLYMSFSLRRPLPKSHESGTSRRVFERVLLLVRVPGLNVGLGSSCTACSCPGISPVPCHTRSPASAFFLLLLLYSYVCFSMWLVLCSSKRSQQVSRLRVEDS